MMNSSDSASDFHVEAVEKTTVFRVLLQELSECNHRLKWIFLFCSCMCWIYTSEKKKHRSCSAAEVFWEWIMSQSSRERSFFITEVINAAVKPCHCFQIKSKQRNNVCVCLQHAWPRTHTHEVCTYRKIYSMALNVLFTPLI